MSNNCDLNYKKLYILNNIDLIENHNKIVNFIFYYNIRHTVNSNGYFINISKIQEDLLDKLYNLVKKSNDDDIYHYIKGENEIIKYINDEIIDNTIEKTINTNTNKIDDNINDNINDIKINSFNGIERDLIKKSKNYKFE